MNREPISDFGWLGRGTIVDRSDIAVLVLMLRWLWPADHTEDCDSRWPNSFGLE